MTDMRLDRTFWPVGHGAFYTEHFRNPENNHIFTAVYDCGGKKEEIIHQNIDRMKNVAGKNIDVLFISHLHRDHINGLDYLKSKTTIRRIILPYLNKYAFSEAYIYNALTGIKRGHCDTDSPLQQFVLGLGSSDQVDNNITFVLPVEEGGYDVNYELLDIEKIGGHIGSGQPIRISGNIRGNHYPYWIYIPVNVKCDDGKSKKLLDKICKTTHFAHIQNGDDINWHELQNALRSAGKKEIEALRKAYKEIFGGSHNAYSMPVYSGPSYEIHPHYRGIWRYRDSYVQQWTKQRCPQSIYFKNEDHGFNFTAILPCLYMGDFEAKDETKLLELQRILGGYYDIVGMQQIPHHFSLNNHSIELYKNRICAFGNVDNHGDISFTQSVCHEIGRYTPTLVITEEKETKFRCHFEFWY